MCNLCEYTPLCYHQPGAQNEIVLWPVTIDERESGRERRLEGKRRSKNGREGRNPEKEQVCTGNLYQVFLKSLCVWFFLHLCTNSLIYSMSTEVNSSLQPHNYFPYGAYITTERRRKRGGGREKDWESKYGLQKKNTENVASVCRDSPRLTRPIYKKVVHPCTPLEL